MKCKQCGYENYVKANYCKMCGCAFSDEEKEEAYRKTIYGKLDSVELFWKRLTLSTITEHFIFRVCVLLLIVGYGVFMVYQRGGQLRILESDQYRVEYSENLDRYYLISDDSMISLGLYIPFQADEIMFITKDVDGNVLKEERVEDAQDIELANTDSYYYEVVANTNVMKQTLTIYIENK